LEENRVVQSYKKLLSVVLALLVSVLVAGCGALGGGDQGYPSRDITFIIPYAPGGSTDPIGRQFAQQLEGILGAEIVVENREGASATIGTGAVVTAEPNGYTIGMSTSSALILQSLLREDLPYGSPEDYQLLGKFADLAPSITVRDDAPWQTIDEFMNYAKENPGEVRISTSGELSTPSLNVLALNEATGVELEPVPFSGGGGEALTALLGGRVEATAGYPSTIQAEVEAGKVRVLASFTEEQFEFFPDSVSIVEAGYFDDPELTPIPSRYFPIAPSGMPEDVRNTLIEASQEVILSDEFRQFIEENGYTYDPVPPEELAAQLETDRRTYNRVLEAAGVETVQ
jgi:tripartite-type tricarboxylate transporter receptor subunit TctC